MAETTAIDLISYSKAATTTKSVSKSYMDNSSTFGNVLENANKSYSQNDSANTKVTQQQQTNGTTDDSAKSDVINKDNNTQNIQEKSIPNKVREKSRENNSDEKNNSQNDSAQEEKQSVSDSSDNKTEVETTVQEQPTNDKAVVENSDTAKKPEPEIKAIAEPEIKIATNENLNLIIDNLDLQNAVKPATETNTQTPADVVNTVNAVNAVNTVNAANTVGTQNNEIIAPQPKAEKIGQANTIPEETNGTTESTSKMTEVDINKPLPTGGENVIGLIAPQPKTDPVVDTTAETNTNNQTNVIKQDIETAQPDFKVNLANSTDKLNLINAQQNTVKNEIQIPINLAVKPQKNDTKTTEVQQQEPNTLTAQTPEPEDTSTETPVVKVSTEILASNTDINTTADSNKNQSIKTSLNQEVLDKMNTKITNVNKQETSDKNSSNPEHNSNSNNMSQNTQDQVAKLSIESYDPNTTNSTISADISNISADATKQIDLTNVHTTTQAPTQSQVSQQPRDISNNEILSQINNKFSHFKNEDTTKINIILKPENLGRINVELINSKEGLTAQLTTNNPQVKEILDKSLDGLKDNLSNQGINVNNVTIKVEETQKQSESSLSFENQMGQNQNQGQSGNMNNSKENKYSFESEIDNVTSTMEDETEIENDMQTEKQVSVGTVNGRVNYKV